MSADSLERAVLRAIPQVIKNNRERYSFIYPFPQGRQSRASDELWMTANELFMKAGCGQHKP
jgi:hypothetical protein